MRIEFMTNGIKDFSFLYKIVEEEGELPFGGMEMISTPYDQIEDYCKKIINDTISSCPDFSIQEYYGCHERLGNEVYELSSPQGSYEVALTVDTYEKKAARMQVTIQTRYEVDAQWGLEKRYDRYLEQLKIAIKNCIKADWNQCTWLVDDQSELLNADLYPRIFRIENQIRAFCSRVLIRRLGTQWLNLYGLEKYKASIMNMSVNFKQRVPDFNDIDASFMSMTLETLFDVLKKGKSYKELVPLAQVDFQKIHEIIASAQQDKLFSFMQAKREVDINIWDDLFAQYFDEPEKFWTTVTQYIKNRNHVAHNKLVSWSVYRTISVELDEITRIVSEAQEKYNNSDFSEEVLMTLQLEAEQTELEADYNENYWRDRLRDETGVDILSDDDIFAKFDETITELYNALFDRYHYDPCFGLSTSGKPVVNGTAVLCKVQSNASEEAVEIVISTNIDGDSDADSTLTITCYHGSEKIADAQIVYHNGSGHEHDDGSMLPDSESEYNESELDDFENKLFNYVEGNLNPLIAEMNTLAYKAVKEGDQEPVADFPCEECGKFGISVLESFLPIGKCCYCGYENEVHICELCGTIFDDTGGRGNICNGCYSEEDE